MEGERVLRMVSAQIEVIETVWGILFLNREDVCRWIAGLVHDDRQVLTVTSALNNWIAVSGRSGRLELTRGEFERIVKNIKW
jgi:hypothetical protein